MTLSFFERRCPHDNQCTEPLGRGFFWHPRRTPSIRSLVVPADGTGAAIFNEWRLRHVPNFYWHSKRHMGRPDVNYNRNCKISCRLLVPICSKRITMANCVCDVRSGSFAARIIQPICGHWRDLGGDDFPVGSSRRNRSVPIAAYLHSHGSQVHWASGRWGTVLLE
jgi:hypothetical protein